MIAVVITLAALCILVASEKPAERAPVPVRKKPRS